MSSTVEKVKERLAARRAEAVTAYLAAIWKPDPDADELLGLAEAAGRVDSIEADLGVVEGARGILAAGKDYAAAEKAEGKAQAALDTAVAGRDEVVEKLDAEVAKASEECEEAKTRLATAEKAWADLQRLRAEHADVLAAASLPAWVAKRGARDRRRSERNDLLERRRAAAEDVDLARRNLADAEEGTLVTPRMGVTRQELLEARREALNTAEQALAEADATLKALPAD